MKRHRISPWHLACVLSLLPLPAGAIANAAECARIYHDNRKHALFLENLLGHFPDLQVIVAPIANYAPGKLSECSSTFYVGASASTRIPKAFLDDLASGADSGRVMWIGNSLDQLGDRLPSLLGFRHKGLAGVDREHLDSQGWPTFFRNILYKGETFPKFAEYRDGNLRASYQMTILEKARDDAELLAEAVHSYSGERIPYAVRRGKLFYVADIPFTDVYPDDRYFVFADLLFDALGAPARWDSQKRPAVLRVEDVHPCVKPQHLMDIAAVAAEFSIPLNIALIPIWADPLHLSKLCPEDRLPLDRKPEIVETLRTLKAAGASFIWHGVTHQYESEKNKLSGASGDDYEFWNARDGKPVALDTPDWVLDRLDTGWAALMRAGLRPEVWEVPHYNASPLDYLIFGRVFSWTIGGIKTMPYSSNGLPVPRDERLWYARSGLEGSEARKKVLRDLTATGALTEAGSQSFPYEIYGDAYGQRVLPENLGYPTSLAGPSGVNADTLLERARRNRVLRDSWGSFFMHPYLIGRGSREANLSALRKLLGGMVRQGYAFVSVDEFIRDRKNVLRPAPVHEHQ